MKKDNTIDAFLALIRAGLWEEEVTLSKYGVIDYERILLMAEEQSVVGLVAAGIEHVKDVRIPQEIALTFVGNALQLENSNREMNKAIEVLINDFYEKDIFSVLVKGQGIAQCYKRPMWRASGDIDLLLDEENYPKAKEYFKKEYAQTEKENPYRKHIAFSMKGFIVELHGTLRVGLSKRWDKELDSVQDSTLRLKDVRSWKNGAIKVYLPDYNNDVVFVFAHIIQHLYKGGIGIRQICDWCRLMWTGRDCIKPYFIQQSIKNLGLMNEWNVLSQLAVTYLGLPGEIVPVYVNRNVNDRKAQRLMRFIEKTGNFGQSRDLTYYQRRPYLIRKLISFNRRADDFFTLLLIFPRNTFSFFMKTFINGIRAVIKGE